jgi:hypothetical protein
MRQAKKIALFRGDRVGALAVEIELVLPMKHEHQVRKDDAV